MRYSIKDLATARQIISMSGMKCRITGKNIIPNSFMKWAENVISFFSRLWDYARSLKGAWSARIKMAWAAAAQDFQEKISASQLMRADKDYIVSCFNAFCEGKEAMVLLEKAIQQKHFTFTKADGSQRAAEGEITHIFPEKGYINYFDSEKQDFRRFRIERLQSQPSELHPIFENILKMHGIR